MFQSLSQLNNRLSLGVCCSSTGSTYVGFICLLFLFFFFCVHAVESEQIDTYLIWIKDETPFFLNKCFD